MKLFRYALSFYRSFFSSAAPAPSLCMVPLCIVLWLREPISVFCGSWAYCVACFGC